MKLKELLKELQNQNVNIKVGANTSFVYCGTCGENIFETMELVNQKCIEDIQRKISRNTMESPRYKKYLSKYVHILERKVLFCVDGISKDELNTKVIRITGIEIGKYWTIKEYQRKN